MYYYFTILLSILAFNFSFSQECQTEEIRIEYTNALEIFYVCKTNPKINFKQNKKYTWYAEFSGIKETEDGSGGNLLHGNYKFYDSTKNLREEKNYYLGQIHGEWKSWDENGKLTSKMITDKISGIKYWKFKREDGNWNEWTGFPGDSGSVLKVTNNFGELTLIREIIDYNTEKVKINYVNDLGFAGGIREEYTESMRNRYKGKYTAYFENGNVMVQGQYADKNHVNIRTGTWKFFNEDGSVDAIEQYKTEFESWPNGEMKIAGGYIYDDQSKEWLKRGKWYYFDQSGKLDSIKEFEWGREIEQE